MSKRIQWQGNVSGILGSPDEYGDLILMHLRFFGAGNIPHLDIGTGGVVEVDSAFHAHLARAEDFKNSVTPQTWSIAHRYAIDLHQRGVKIAFFGNIPQSKVILNTRNALLRLAHCLGIDIRW
jgi:hypothetical protein